MQADEVINTEHAARFESLVVQDNGGRLKPAHTLCSEFLRKIYGKDRFINLSSKFILNINTFLLLHLLRITKEILLKKVGFEPT